MTQELPLPPEVFLDSWRHLDSQNQQTTLGNRFMLKGMGQETQSQSKEKICRDGCGSLLAWKAYAPQYSIFFLVAIPY